MENPYEATEANHATKPAANGGGPAPGIVIWILNPALFVITPLLCVCLSASLLRIGRMFLVDTSIDVARLASEFTMLAFLAVLVAVIAAPADFLAKSI